MKKIVNTGQNGGIPLYWDDFRFLQEAYTEALKATITPWGVNDVSGKIVSGCDLVSVGGGAQLRVTDGWVYLNGELFRHVEQTYNVPFAESQDNTSAPTFVVRDYSMASGNRVKENGGTIHIHKEYMVEVELADLTQPNMPDSVHTMKRLNKDLIQIYDNKLDIINLNNSKVEKKPVSWTPVTLESEFSSNANPADRLRYRFDELGNLLIFGKVYYQEDALIGTYNVGTIPTTISHVRPYFTSILRAYSASETHQTVECSFDNDTLFVNIETIGTRSVDREICINVSIPLS